MKSYGFTLLELLIVIAIAAAFTGILLPQISQFSGSQNLRTEAEKLQAALRGAQTNVASGTRCDATRSANYWRLKFDSNKSYKIDSCFLDVGEETGFLCNQSCSALNPVVLSNDVIIATVSTNRSFTNPATCNKVTDTDEIKDLGVAFKGINAVINFFQPPTNHTLCYFSNDLMISKTFIITLQRTNFPGELINVTVDKGGSIYLSPN